MAIFLLDMTGLQDPCECVSESSYSVPGLIKHYQKKVCSSREKYFECPEQAIDEKVKEPFKQKRVPWHLVKCTTIGQWGV